MWSQWPWPIRMWSAFFTCWLISASSSGSVALGLNLPVKNPESKRLNQGSKRIVLLPKVISQPSVPNHLKLTPAEPRPPLAPGVSAPSATPGSTRDVPQSIRRRGETCNEPGAEEPTARDTFGQAGQRRGINEAHGSLLRFFGSRAHAVHLVVLADALADLHRDLAAALGALHGTVLGLERLDGLSEVGRVTADMDRVADLEGTVHELDRRDTDLRVVVRDRADLLLRGHCSPLSFARLDARGYFSAPAVRPET